MIKTQNKQLIDVSDWDDLVMKTYGRLYSLQQQDGCKSRGTEHITVPSPASDYENDSVPEEINGEDVMGVSFASWIARNPEEWNGEPEDKMFLDLFWERNFYPELQTVANDLHEKGLLPAGEYVIEIDW